MAVIEIFGGYRHGRNVVREKAKSRIKTVTESLSYKFKWLKD